MDLLDFHSEPLYFDDPMPAGVDALIREASVHYSDGTAEPFLLRAYFMAPRQLAVLVALYRFYFYQHRLEDAQIVADRAMSIVAQRLGFPASWRELSLHHLGAGVTLSMGLVRFYLMTLKAAALLCLRCGQIEEGLAMLETLTELDTRDRIGGRALLDVARCARARVRAQA